MTASTAPQEICFWGHQQLSIKPLTQAAVSANRVMSLAYRVTLVKVYLERNVSFGHWDQRKRNKPLIEGHGEQ
jgi:hypothetical protein